jgi:CheY-like chemotaxis protein
MWMMALAAAASRSRTRRPAHPVLIVDDNPDILRSIADLFQLEGFRVVTATGGKDALQRLRDGLRPCAIVVDLGMPANGLDFWRTLLADRRFSRIPIAAYTASDTLERQATAMGLTVFQKLGDEDQLIEFVSRHCSAQRKMGAA